MKKAIILARVSTPEQEETGLSIDKIQLPQMFEYAKENGFEVDKKDIFTFQETASQKFRKKFDAMIEYVKFNDEIKAIIALRVDRMTRNFRDAVEMDHLRIEYGKELHFVSDRLVLTSQTYGPDIQNWDFQVVMAKQHINNCQKHAHDTLNSKLESGETYGHAPYGYKNISDKTLPPNERVKIDTFEAGIVKKVFDMYTIGTESYRSISQKLNKQYVSLYMSKSKVESIIKNHYYYGERMYQEVLYPHIFEPIISKEVYTMAQDKRIDRTKTQKKGKLLGKTGLYRGLIYCECGCAMSPSQNRHKKLGRPVRSDSYYYCTNAKGIHKKKPKGTNDDELTKLFAELFKSIQIPEKDLDLLVNSLTESHEGKKRFTKSEVSECNRQIKNYQNMIENAYADKCKPSSDPSSITQVEYDNYRSKWRNKQDEYKTRLARIMEADEEYYITASYLLELASRSYELFMGSEPHQKRKIITLTLQNLTWKDGKLEYDWIKPFDSIFSAKDRLEWGG